MFPEGGGYLNSSGSSFKLALPWFDPVLFFQKVLNQENRCQVMFERSGSPSVYLDMYVVNEVDKLPSLYGSSRRGI